MCAPLFSDFRCPSGPPFLQPPCSLPQAVCVLTPETGPKVARSHTQGTELEGPPRPFDFSHLNFFFFRGLSYISPDPALDLSLHFF